MKKGIIIAIVAGLSIILPGMNSVLGQDWPQWRGPDRNSKVDEFKVPAVWPGELNQQWKIYVFTRLDENEILQCLEASTGKVLWKESYTTDEVTGPAARHPGPRSTPAVINGKAVIIGATGIISCFNAESGKLLWRNQDYENVVPTFFTGMSPIVLDHKCFAHLGGSERSAIIAFDLATGSILWKYEADGPAYASPDIMIFDNSKQIVMQTEKTLLGLSTNDGEILWKIPTPVESRFYNSSSPLIDGHKIFYTGQGNGSRAVNIRRKGNDYSVFEIWENPAIGTNYNTPVLKDGYLYGLSNLGYLYCLNASNGEIAWTDTTRHRDFGSIIDAGSVMLALSSTSNLVVFKPETDNFKQIALIKVAETPIYAHPLLSGNKIYIKDEESLILYNVE